jgi:CheY-like chemotaxis protein/MinD-like ATPase involved in chromosome partitioning or flagellar assembly
METKMISVLIIDSDASTRNYLGMIFQKKGYSVLTASNAREGLILAWKDLPDIILFDPQLPDFPGLELVNRLHQDHRTVNVPCVALSRYLDAKDMNTLLSAGCNEYLTKSNQTLSQLLELIPRLLQEESATPKKRGILVAFLSSKGGMGTSSLCANIATCLGSKEIETRVAVMDLVLPIGSMADIVGYEDQMNVVTTTLQDPAQTTPDYFKNNLPRIPNWYFHLLAGSPDPESANLLVVNRLEGIINSILESFDFLLIDMGRALSRVSLPIIQKADVVVLIVGTDNSSAILAKTVWSYLKNQGVDPRRFYTLQNRAVGLEGLKKAELEQMTGLKIQLTIPYMSGDFTIANNRHEPIIEKYPNDTFSYSLKQAAIQIAELGLGSRVL